MLDNFIYESHTGQRFVGLNNGVYLNESELRDYEWSYDTTNSRISRLYRSTFARKIPLVIACASDAAAIAVRNQLYELTDSDVLAGEPGRVWIGDYYTRGYILKSVKSGYLASRRMCTLELELTSDSPAWYRETTVSLPPTSGGGTSGGYDYPFDYEYDYAVDVQGRQVVAAGFAACAFRMIIYGPTVSPTVYIGGHAYTVNYTVSAGEYLTVDSALKTILLTTASGYTVNLFDKRSRDSYIFEPVPAGTSTVAWDGSFGVDLTLIEERSEPKWT